MPVGDLVGRVLPAVRALLPGEASCEALVEEALAYNARPSAQPLLQTGRTTLRDGVEQLLLIGGEVKKILYKSTLKYSSTIHNLSLSATRFTFFLLHSALVLLDI